MESWNWDKSIVLIQKTCVKNGYVSDATSSLC